MEQFPYHDPAHSPESLEVANHMKASADRTRYSQSPRLVRHCREHNRPRTPRVAKHKNCTRLFSRKSDIRQVVQNVGSCRKTNIPTLAWHSLRIVGPRSMQQARRTLCSVTLLRNTTTKDCFLRKRSGSN